MTLPIISTVDGVRGRIVRARRVFDARAPRERLLLIAAAVAVAWMVADAAWLAPAFTAWNAARTHREAAVAALARMQQEEARRIVESRTAEQQLRAETAQWRERVQEGDEHLRAVGATLVRAVDMVPMLERLTAQVGGLRLRSMRSLGTTDALVAVVAGGAASTPAGASPALDPKAAGGLYRHGVELVVEGPYADVLAYLRAIEAMPQRVLGGGLKLKVERHPTVVMTLQLYTLSQDRNWLEI